MPSQALPLLLVGGIPTVRVEMGFSTLRVLELLISRADSIVTREELLAYAWPNRVVTQSSLNQAVKSIREWLGDDDAKEVIHTIPRGGYQFSSVFLGTPGECPAAEPVDPAAPALSHNPATPAANGMRRSFGWSVTPALLVCALVLGGSLLWRVDWPLLLQPGVVTSEHVMANQRLLYIAPDQARLETLQAKLMPLRERLLGLADTPGTLLFNQRHDFYEVVCIDQDSAAEFLTLHASQLLECLK